MPTTAHPNPSLPTAIEMACIDLLARQENVIDQLVQPDERGDDLQMLTGATQILAAFLSFADQYSDDESAIELAQAVTDVAVKTATLRDQINSQDSGWFSGSKKPDLDVRDRYNALGNDIIRLSGDQLTKCSSMFREGTDHKKRFVESSLVFLKEFKARW